MVKKHSKRENNFQEVRTEEELLDMMKNQEFYILIKGALNEKVKELLRTKISDEGLMGAELGSAGTNSLLSEIIYKIVMLFKEDSKTNRQLESKIRQYNFGVKDGEILLYLRQLDY